MGETVRPNTLTTDGQYYISEAPCMLRYVVELEPHDACSGGKGALIVPLVPGKDTHEVGYRCETCEKIVFQHARGICL